MPGETHHLQGPSTPGRLAASSGLFALNFVFQALGGLWTGSLGLVSDSLENLNDTVVNLLAMGSIHLANRREPCDRYSYGWHRLEIFQSLLGVLLLLVLAGAVLWEAFRRLAAPPHIRIGWAMAFSALGLLLNLGATLVLLPPRGSRLEGDLNLRGAYLHALGDSLANLGVLTSMVLIRFTGWRWVDPLMAIAIVLFILRGAYLLARDALGILMHRAAFDPGEARRRLMAIPGVEGVEDLHSWRACSHLTICTAHVIVAAERLEETRGYLSQIESVMAHDFGVRHMTVHFETAAMSEDHTHRFAHRHEDAHAGHGH